MVSAAPEAPEAAADSTDTPHWLYGRYFVPMPDLSDEARWVISQGRAWPVFTGLMSLLHTLERKGTEPQKVAARAGRIEHLGVTGLAAAIGPGRADAKHKGASTKAVLRQLRFLERQGFIRTSQGTFTTEVDRATGRIVKNFAKCPPKVIELTLRDSHYRPQAGTSRPRAVGCETHPGREGVGCETHPKAPAGRERNAPVPKDSGHQRARSPLDSERQDASGPRKGPDTPASRGSTSTVRTQPVYRAHTPCPRFVTEEQVRRRRFSTEEEVRHNREKRDHGTRQRTLANYVARCAKTLGITEAEVIEIGRADKNDLVRRLEAAGADPATGRRRLTQEVVLKMRQSLTESLSLHHEPQEGTGGTEAAGDTLEQEAAAAALREALAGMTEKGRGRARALGKQIGQGIQGGKQSRRGRKAGRRPPAAAAVAAAG